MAFRAGFTVTRADLAKASGAVKGDVTPATKVLHFVHKGSYATLRDDYALLMDHVGKEGLALGAPSWEVYLNDPSTTAADDLITECFVALA